MLLCGYTPVTWQTFPATPKCLTTNFLLISTSPFPSYLSSYKNVILEPAAKKCPFHQSPETHNQFFSEFIPFKKLAVGFSATTEKPGTLQVLLHLLYLSSVSSLCDINSKTLIQTAIRWPHHVNPCLYCHVWPHRIQQIHCTGTWAGLSVWELLPSPGLAQPSEHLLTHRVMQRQNRWSDTFSKNKHFNKSNLFESPELVVLLWFWYFSLSRGKIKERKATLLFPFKCLTN